MNRRVEFKEIKSLNCIPEHYWNEDLSLLDRKYEGEVIGTVKSFFGTYLIVACDNGEVKEVEISRCKIIKS